jgi:enoyl-CoA hydratase
MTETIRVDRDGRVAVITLDRPEALNALNAQLMHEVVAAAREVDADPEVGAIVITGSDRAFAAGADIKELAGYDAVSMLAADPVGGWDELAALRTPLIAAVAGYALGGGCEIAMLCDLVIAADTARFGQPEITLGVMPGLGGTQRLTRAVGKATAMDMVLTGRTMDAREALAAGLVARVVPADRLHDEALDVARIIASRSLPAAIAAKESVNRAYETTLAEGLRFERRSFASLFALEDRREGMAAFVEKRSPEFKHR